MKHVVGLIAVVLAMVGLTLGALAQARVIELERVTTDRDAATAQRITDLELKVAEQGKQLHGLNLEHQQTVNQFGARIETLEEQLETRDRSYAAAIKALQEEITQLQRRAAGFTPGSERGIKGSGTQLYIVNPKSKAPTVVLWRTAERTAKKGIAYIPKGTKCTLLDAKDMGRGAYMYKVRAVTGEEGWIPFFCLEFRRQ